MNLLILVIVMGVIGVIGTVEYAHAQTIMTLDPLPNTPDPKHGATSIYIHAPGNRSYWYLADKVNTVYYNNRDMNVTTSELTTPISEVFVPGPRTPLVPHTILVNSTQTKQCNLTFDDVRVLLTIPANKKSVDIINLTIPNNIRPQGNDTVIAVGINWSNPTSGDYECPIELVKFHENSIELTKELRWTLYNQSDKKAYHFSPREGITQAREISLCTSDNLNTTDQTLKGDTKMCYGKHGNNMVIITKKLTGFYGAADIISSTAIAPAPPTQTTPPKQPTQPTAPTGPDADAYTKLLARLYLPPI